MALEDGRGVQQDFEKALELCFSAEMQWEHADAQYKLGKMYESGRGVQQNYKEAVKWYRKASQQGNTDAEYKLIEIESFALI